MSLINSTISWLSGTGFVDQEAEGRRIDAEANKAFAEARDLGYIGNEDYTAGTARRSATETRTGSYVADIGDGFKEGLAEGYDNVTGDIRKGINFPFKFLWDAVPGWLWFVLLVGGGVALFLYMGGGALLKGRLAKSA